MTEGKRRTRVKSLDLTGVRVGSWIALERDSTKPQYWLCRCDCGIERGVFVGALRAGTSTSCGCKRKKAFLEDAIHRLYKIEDCRWTILGLSKHQIPGSTRRWDCRCVCGTERTVGQQSLLDGTTKSCGCYRDDRNTEMYRLPPDIGAANNLIGQYRRGAIRRGLVWELSMLEAQILFKGDCRYCGHPPTNTAKTKYKGPRGIEDSLYKYNGIDRVDNTKGYTIDNVVSCCKYCNTAKSNHSIEEFSKWVADISRNNSYGIAFVSTKLDKTERCFPTQVPNGPLIIRR